MNKILVVFISIGIFLIGLFFMGQFLNSDNSLSKSVEPISTPSKSVEPISTPSSNCHPSYSGCLKADASDYDCIGGSGNGPYYTGKVRVIGPDVFGLDRDHDGWGCE